MKYTVIYDYEIGDSVKIKDLDVCGHVIALFTGEFGNQYEVAYFYDGALRKEYLFSFQIKPSVTENGTGFKK